jgi:hypothetical protein
MASMGSWPCLQAIASAKWYAECYEDIDLD